MKHFFLFLLFSISAFTFAKNNIEEVNKESFVEKLSSMVFGTKTTTEEQKQEDVIHIDIIDACKKNDVERIKQAIKYKLDFNVIDENGDNPFFIACKNGNIALASLLLSSKNADVNARDSNNQTVFMRACINGNKDIIDFITEKDFAKKYKQKCNVLLRDNNNQDAFMLLCVNDKVDLRNGREQLVADKLLLTNYSIINEKDSDGDTALIKAAKLGNKKAVKYLLTREADEKITDANGDSILVFLCRNGLFSMVETFLSDFHIDINAKNKYGKTALMVLAEENNEDAINFLLEKGADINILDNYGKNLFMYACNGHSFKLANKLLSKSFNINAQDKQGNTALHQACLNNDKVAIEYLCEKDGLDIEIKNVEGLSSIALYCKTINIDFSENYDERVVNIVASDNTVLLQMFLYDEKNFLYSSDDISSIMVIAAEKGSVNDVKYLIENNLYLDYVNDAIKVSKKNNNDEITVLLNAVKILLFRKKLTKVLVFGIPVIILFIFIICVYLKKTASSRKHKKEINKEIEKQNLNDIEGAFKRLKNKLDDIYRGGIYSNDDLLFIKSELEKNLQLLDNNKKILNNTELQELVEHIEILKNKKDVSLELVKILNNKQDFIKKLIDEKKGVFEKITEKSISQSTIEKLEIKKNENIEE